MPNDEHNPSVIIISFAITISVFPVIIFIIDTILSKRRSTLRDILTCTQGLILAAYIAFPIYFFLVEREPHIFGQTVFPLALLIAAIGVTWYIISLTLTPLIIRYQNKLLATI